MKKIIFVLFFILFSYLFLFADDYISDTFTYKGGNFGIGTTNPLSKFEVAGTISGTTLKTATYTLPSGTGATNEVLKITDGVLGWQADVSGGSPAWGSITGSMAAQTDLQGILDGKAEVYHYHAFSDITSGTIAAANLGLIDLTSQISGTIPISNLGIAYTLPATTGTVGQNLIVVDGNAAWKQARQTSKLTSALSVTTSTAPTTTLTMAVEAGKYYNFQYKVVFSSTVATCGLRVGVTYPTATLFAASASIPIAADGAGGAFQGWITTPGDMAIGTAVQTANTNYLATIDGVIIPSASGNLSLIYASELTGSGITIKEGSLVILEEMD